MKRSIHIFALSALCALLAGCPSSREDAGSPNAKVPTRPAADLGTPESAVKSYWRMLDWLRLRQRIEDIREAASEGRVKSADVMSSVSKGDALASFAKAPRSDLRLERTIVSGANKNDYYEAALPFFKGFDEDDAEIAAKAVLADETGA